MEVEETITPKCPPEEGKTDENDNHSAKRLKVEDKMEEEVPQRLDVPSKELQAIRKQVMIEKLMGKEEGSTGTEGTEKAPGTSQRSSKKPFRIPQTKPKKTFKLESSVLARVKSFLPEMKTANEDLLKIPDPSKISLESDSDMDEVDQKPIPGTSSSTAGAPEKSKEKITEPLVEMNIAVVDFTDSDTSSDDEDFKIAPRNKCVPKSMSKGGGEEEKLTEEKPSDNNLITELN